MDRMGGSGLETMFESIPLTVRLGMHLLYCGRESKRNGWVIKE